MKKSAIEFKKHYIWFFADGKTFVIVFCVLWIDSTQLFTRRKRLGQKFCHLQQSVNSTLVHSHFDLASLPLALEATEPVSKPVSQIALDLIINHLISVQQKRSV